MVNRNRKWTFSRDEENFYNDEFDTREEAIAAGRGYYDEDSFYVGRIEHPGTGVLVDVSSILDHINCNMVDECGHWAKDYLIHTKPEHDNELEQKLCQIISEWIERHGYEPTFYKVVDIEKIESE